MPANDLKQYEESEDFMPYPSDTNDKPFMTYEQLQSGAPGKACQVMSSGQYKAHRGFNSVQIRNGYIVRLNKNGTVRGVLGKYGDYGKNNKA